MKTIGLIIIDDEKSARDLLKDLLLNVSWVEILGEAEGVEEALKEIRRKAPDVILLDVQMPVMDGFVLVEKLLEHKIHTEVIFITAFEKYAIRAIRSSAFDYLLKPVRKSDLTESLEKLALKVASARMEEQFTDLIRQLSDTKKLKFKNRTGFSMIDPDDVLFCMADSNYTDLHLDSGRTLTVSMNLGKVEEVLPALSFVRISRSALVNLRYLTKVNRKTLTCTIEHDTMHHVPVSRKYLQNLEECCDRPFL
ncbi:MAG: LytTR family DNA-binding domain-containing protein [Bacteroidales bacterium]